MSLKKVEQVKGDKLFRLADLIIYGVIAALAAALFFALFLTRDGGDLRGIRIYVRDKIVFEYDFEENSYEIKDGCAEITEKSGDVLILKITAENGYNIVRIDGSARSVSVTEADCRSRDCVHTPPIADNGSIIYCSPHFLLIEPFNRTEDGTVIM